MTLLDCRCKSNKYQECYLKSAITRSWSMYKTIWMLFYIFFLLNHLCYIYYRKELKRIMARNGPYQRRSATVKHNSQILHTFHYTLNNFLPLNSDPLSISFPNTSFFPIHISFPHYFSPCIFSLKPPIFFFSLEGLLVDGEYFFAGTQWKTQFNSKSDLPTTLYNLLGLRWIQLVCVCSFFSL